MLSIFKKRSEPATFKERVTQFWDWFQEVAPRFYETIESKKCANLTLETSSKVDELFPGFAWVFGPGENGEGHSFTLSGEGVEHKQLLALEWYQRAPSIQGWTFYPSRQPGPIQGKIIEIFGLKMDPKEIWVTPELDAESECVNLTMWHPLWDSLDDSQRWTIVFIFLDECLGEYGTQWWIGSLDFGADKLADSFPLEELEGYVSEVVARNEWKKYPPGDCYTLYRLEPDEDENEKNAYPRSDLFTLSTSAPNLFRDYMESGGEFADPLNGTGAQFVYVSVDGSYFPAGAEVDKRSEVEEALDAVLKSEQSGRCVGGGLGKGRGYVDLLILDGKRSLAIIEKSLKTLNIASGSSIEFFDRNQRSQRVRLR